MSVLGDAEWGLLAFTGVICRASVELGITEEWGSQSSRQDSLFLGVREQKEEPQGGKWAAECWSTPNFSKACSP